MVLENSFPRFQSSLSSEYVIHANVKNNTVKKEKMPGMNLLLPWFLAKDVPKTDKPLFSLLFTIRRREAK
jgi:uncharacterized protein YcbK (DUF882 family)